MKATVDNISKPNVTDGAYVVEYSILNDNGEVEQTQLEIKVEAGQSAKELLKAKVASYVTAKESIDVEVGQEI